MSALLFLQDLSTYINVPIWGLGLTGVGVTASIFFGAHKIAAANKTKTYDRIDKVEVKLTDKIEKVEVKKVDMTLFEKTVTSIENKVNDNKIDMKDRFDSIDKKIDDVNNNVKMLVKYHLKEK